MPRDISLLAFLDPSRPPFTLDPFRKTESAAASLKDRKLQGCNTDISPDTINYYVELRNTPPARLATTYIADLVIGAIASSDDTDSRAYTCVDRLGECNFRGCKSGSTVVASRSSTEIVPRERRPRRVRIPTVTRHCRRTFLPRSSVHLR